MKMGVIKVAGKYRVIKTDYFGLACYEVYCGSVFEAQFRTKVSALKFIESDRKGDE